MKILPAIYATNGLNDVTNTYIRRSHLRPLSNSGFFMYFCIISARFFGTELFRLEFYGGSQGPLEDY